MHFISRTHTLSSYFITEMCCVKRKYANGESLAWDIMTVGAHVWQRTVERGEMMGNINVGRFTLSLLIVSVKYTIRSKCVLRCNGICASGDLWLGAKPRDRMWYVKLRISVTLPLADWFSWGSCHASITRENDSWNKE